MWVAFASDSERNQNMNIYRLMKMLPVCCLSDSKEAFSQLFTTKQSLPAAAKVKVVTSDSNSKQLKSCGTLIMASICLPRLL